MNQKLEFSYIELLSKLHDDVDEDMIPAAEKTMIVELIQSLEKLLWKYSY